MGQGADQVPVEPRDRLQGYGLWADSSALTDVGAAAESLRIMLSHHADHPGVTLGLALRQQSQVSDLRGGEQHRRAVGAGGDAGTAPDAGSRVKRAVGISFGDGI